MSKTTRSFVEAFFIQEMPKVGYKVRPCQVSLAVKIESVLDRGANLLAEAGVGTGKTFAYMIPALQKGATLVSTNTISLQEQIVSKDIPAIQQFFEDKIKAKVIKGKPQYFCPANYKNNISSISRKDINTIDAWLDQGNFEKSTVANISDSTWKKISMDYQTNCLNCPMAQGCKTFEERSSWKSYQHAYVTNHGQLIQILNQWSLNKESVLDKPTSIVVDEAHQLLPMVQEFLTSRISVHSALELMESLQYACNLSPELRERSVLLEVVLESILKQLDQVEAIHPDDTSNRYLIGSFPVELLQEIAYAGDLALGLLQETQPAGFTVASHFLKLFVEACETTLNPAHIKWIEFDGKNRLLCSLREDPGKWLNKNLFSLGIPVIYISATLAVNDTFAYTIKELDHVACEEFISDSPFDYDNQVKVETRFTDRYDYQNQEVYYQNTFSEIEKVIDENQGNTLVLFTSKHAVAACKKYFESYTKYPVIFQEETGISEVIERFKTTPNSSLIGTGFWEGLDVPGSKLSAVVIPKLPFPQPDSLLNYKIEIAKQNNLDPFQEVILPQMLLKLKQGVGRLIRSETDHGKIVVLDSRFRRSRIRWTQVLPFRYEP
jgi:ATP-dependent DNA helicase DinG